MESRAVFQAETQAKKFPLNWAPVQVRRLLHGPARAERAAALDRRAAGRTCQALAQELPRPHEVHQQRQQEGFHGAQGRLRREGCQQRVSGHCE